MCFKKIIHHFKEKRNLDHELERQVHDLQEGPDNQELRILHVKPANDQDPCEGIPSYLKKMQRFYIGLCATGVTLIASGTVHRMIFSGQMDDNCAQLCKETVDSLLNL
jgi:hypothetical protein